MESGACMKILLIDDDPDILQHMKKALQILGHTCDFFEDPLAALNQFNGDRYDLVISDVDMPRMDGIKLVASIRSDPRLKGLPVMIVSYKDRQEDRVRGLEAGADYYLTKSSFDDDTFIKAVYDLIGGESS